ncbi:glutathione S-transferase family protein [Caulobacter sp. RL271]|jgi:glutathione S-transferase|uniref:Glutathione S-transferase family protein n=1 Tax=Caulobacter segnis TaxID=88688 RepID=A0ABY4ZS70_9CAUL|nr:glutathione S-transferase family protein [Caulobacter segnis]USQ95441.1 glutathione S-transferase family protein [Caulobacter segnis]
MSGLTLYHHKGACSLAPLIALEESGLDYSVEIINLATDRPGYLKVNPAGKVPALVLDGELLTENLAILYRIASLAPAAGLLPSGLEETSRTLSLMAWFGSTVHILRRQIRMPLRFTPDADAQAKLVEAGRPKMWEALLEMEARLGEREWFGGRAFGVADGYALVFYGWGLNDGFPMEELEKLTTWKDRMLSRPAVLHAIRNDAGVLHDKLEAAA